MTARPLPFPMPAWGGLAGPVAAAPVVPIVRIYPRLVRALTRASNRWGEPVLYNSRVEGLQTLQARLTTLKTDIVFGAEMIKRRICVISPEHWDGVGFTVRPARGDEVTDSEHLYRVESVEIARYAGQDGRYELLLEG